MNDAETREWERLAFVAGRDGVTAAKVAALASVLL